MFKWKFVFVNDIVLKVFVGIIAIKPSRDFTRPLWMPMGLKGLLHTFQIFSKFQRYLKIDFLSLVLLTSEGVTP